MNLIRLCYTLFLLIVSNGITPAEEPVQADWLKNAGKQLDSWQKELKRWQNQPPGLALLEQRQSNVSDLRQQATVYAQSNDETLQELTEKIQALGEPQKDEAGDVRQFRRELEQNKKRLENQLALCRVTSLAAQQMIADLKALRSETASRAFGRQEQNIWRKTLALAAEPNWLKAPLPAWQIWPAWLAGLVSLIILYPLALYTSRWLHQHHPAGKKTEPGIFLSHRLAHRLTWIALLASLVIFAYLGNQYLISALLAALLLSLLFAPLLETLLCYRMQHCLPGLPANILLSLILAALLLKQANLDQLLQPLSLDVLYGLYLLAILIISIWLIGIAVYQKIILVRPLSLPLTALLIAGPAAFWLGYQALADLLIPGVYGSLLGLLLVILLYRLLNHLLHQLENQSGTARRLRSLLGYQADEKINGLWFARIMLLIGVAGLLIYVLLLAWNVPKADIDTVLNYLTEGFQLGSTTIVPSKIFGAIVAFFVLMIFARWLKKQLSEHWLKKVALDTGAQQSIVSLTTYSIVGLAILLALNMSGIELQSLAIVAGALSVGIGFGLQNIVNNFVSGLILLFERPVKPGDWVVVGQTEGYVRKISIRYTQIQTFDRSDVLVPNSELISSPVTNWMLRNDVGRVIVKIGVAYGTNTRRIAEILNGIARNHPFVLAKSPLAPAPQVLFMSFGDSSLNFELRCYIKDVNYRLSVHSDLMFAIDDALREEGIEIPFPQSVVHYHNDQAFQAS